jgi:FOG: CBS domain
MHAEHIMSSTPVAIHPNTRVEEALTKMHPGGHRILPVVDGRGVVRGVLSAAAIVAHLLPEYIASGELGDVSFVPDIGVLRRHYLKVKRTRVAACMDEHPVTVHPTDSLLAVTAALARGNPHGCVLVVDDGRHLLGIITPRDVLETLKRLKLDESHDG